MEINSRYTLSIKLIINAIVVVVLSMPRGFSVEQSLPKIASVNTIEKQKHYNSLELYLNRFDQIPQSLFSVESIDHLILRSRSFYLEQAEETDVEEVTDGIVTIGYGLRLRRNSGLPRQLAGIKIKKIVIIGLIRDVCLKPLSSKEIHDWFAEYMPNCEVEVRQRL